MKKFIAILSLTIGIFTHSFSQTATDFTVADCAGTTHHLFTELDTGRVIVLTWVMPCGGCIFGATTAYNIVTDYAISHPGRVYFYLCDDYGNLPCSQLDSWAFTNGIHATTFSDSNIRMSDYGPYAMPKTIVLGGSSHHVFYQYDLGQDTVAMKAAIDSALMSTGIQNSIAVEQADPLFPNPADEYTDVSFAMTQTGDVKVEVYDLSGQLMRSVTTENHYAGIFRQRIDCGDLAEGAYLVKISSGDNHSEQLLAIKHH